MNRVERVTRSSVPARLRRRKDGLEAQHRALDEGRIEDLVRLLHNNDDGDLSDAPADEAEDPSPEFVDELARDVRRLARSLEDRIARARGDTLAELRELDGRIAAARFGAGSQGEATGRRGGRRGATFNGYL